MCLARFILFTQELYWALGSVFAIKSFSLCSESSILAVTEASKKSPSSIICGFVYQQTLAQGQNSIANILENGTSLLRKKKWFGTLLHMVKTEIFQQNISRKALKSEMFPTVLQSLCLVLF